MKLIGQIAYESYCAFTGGKSLVSGESLPQWEAVKHEIKSAWNAAGNAVKLVAERQWPDIGPDPLREREKVTPGIEGVLERTGRPCAFQQAEVPDQTGLCWRWDVDQLRGEVIWRRAAMRARKNYKIVCLCGSSRFCDVAAVKAWEFEKQGMMAVGMHLLPEWYHRETKKTEGHHYAEQENVAHVLDEMHLRKIELADEVYIVNPVIEGWPNGYIGERTRIEIEHARSCGKRVRYMTEVVS